MAPERLIARLSIASARLMLATVRAVLEGSRGVAVTSAGSNGAVTKGDSTLASRDQGHRGFGLWSEALGRDS